MKFLKGFFLITFISVLFISCGESKKTEQEYLDAAKAKMEAEQYEEAIIAYRDLIKNYPKSENAVVAYNQIAGIYFDKMKNYDKAIETYKELAAAFPEKKEAKQSMFMVAFIYDETMKDKQKAIDAYKVFLQKYPEDKDPGDNMSESARQMLMILESGKTPEELIEQRIKEMGTEKDNTKVKENESKEKKEESKDKKPADDVNKDPIKLEKKERPEIKKETESDKKQ